jgi:AraC-like DNA-binding protein
MREYRRKPKEYWRMLILHRFSLTQKGYVERHNFFLHWRRMTRQLISEVFGTISLEKGMPTLFLPYRLPQASSYYANGQYGTVCLQEVVTEKQLLLHFLFALKNSFAFSFINPRKGLHAMLNLSGQFLYHAKERNDVTLLEKEFLLLRCNRGLVHTTAQAERTGSLLHIYYPEQSYAGLAPLFPQLGTFINEPQAGSQCLNEPMTAHYLMLDAIQTIFNEHYASSLQKKFTELQLETCLLGLLAQSYKTRVYEATSEIEKVKANEARQLLENNIKRSWLLEDIAKEIHCGTSWLKKAFRKVYGMGIYHYLRKTRMERAKQMFIQGQSLKAVAIDVGMKPHNFPKEFKAFFGYTVTAFKKGLR